MCGALHRTGCRMRLIYYSRMVVSESDDRDSPPDLHIFDDYTDERADEAATEQIGPIHPTDERAYEAKTEEDGQFRPTYFNDERAMM